MPDRIMVSSGVEGMRSFKDCKVKWTIRDRKRGGAERIAVRTCTVFGGGGDAKVVEKDNTHTHTHIYVCFSIQLRTC